jgi:hypothetical protein
MEIEAERETGEKSCRSVRSEGLLLLIGKLALTLMTLRKRRKKTSGLQATGEGQ